MGVIESLLLIFFYLESNNFCYLYLFLFAIKFKFDLLAR